MKLKLATTLMVLALAIPAMAGGFEHYDKDANGFITADELGEEKAHKMQEMDTNGDELISKAEFNAYKADRAKPETTE